MDEIKAAQYLIVRASLETSGFCCATCESFANGVCTWSVKPMARNGFCTNWSERKERSGYLDKAR